MSMMNRIYILILAFTVSTCHLAASGQDKEEKIKGKHRRLLEEADFFYGLDDHFMSRELYSELVEIYPENMQFNFRLGYSYPN